MSNPNKHHFVPEGYLKSFTDTKKTLWRRKKNETKVIQRTPGMVCYEIDGYTIRKNETLLLNKITDKLHIERNAFKKQENGYRKSMSKISRYTTIPILVDTQSQLLLLSTLLTIKRRNPSSREIITQAYYKGYKDPETFLKFKTEIERVASKQNISLENDFQNQIQDFLMTNAEDSDKLHDNYLALFLKEQSLISSIAKELLKLQQIILHAPVTTQFITSDNPGFTIQEESIRSMGGFNGKFQFLFPLSPKTCLFLSSDQYEHTNELMTKIYPRLISESQVAFINQCTKEIANKIILGKKKEVLQSI